MRKNRIKELISILIISSLSINFAEAREISITQKITGLYVSYFSRAADKEGLDFWEERASTSTNSKNVLKELSFGFAKHPLFISTYAHLNNREFVESIYRNTLGNTGDNKGINFWTSTLNNSLSRSDMVSEFIEASLAGDLMLLSLSADELAIAQKRQNFITHKVNVALEFTTLLAYHTNIENINSPEDDPAYQASIKIIADVTEDISTLNTKMTFLNSIKNDSDPIGLINNRGDKDEIQILSNNDKIAYLDAINQARNMSQDCGIHGIFPATSPLKWNDKLYKSSYEHTQDLVETETFSHTGSGTEFDWTGTKLDHPSSMSERVENYNYSWSTIGENIAAGTFTDTAPKVIQQWLDSDGHCTNLMSDSFTEVGMAMVYNAQSKYKYYWTQDFGRVR